MNLDEERYLEYWEKREKENIEQFECFEHSRKIIVISEDGELEELKVEGYHFETLYERFKVFKFYVSYNFCWCLSKVIVLAVSGTEFCSCLGF